MTGTGDHHDPYADIVAFYDLEHDAFREDIDFYLQLAEVVGDPILELGCGTGRIMLPLAEAGWRVTGLDQSRPMLARAAERVCSAEVGDLATLHEGSMVDADAAPGGPFGLVHFSLNGFMHLLSSADQRRALEATHRALDPRGMLVIDVLNATPDYLHGLNGCVAADGQWALENGDIVQRFSARTVDVSRQSIATTLWYDVVTTRGEVRRHLSQFPLRYVHRSEFELMLELTGFVEWQVYGSYELDPFTDESERLIVTAEVSPSSSSP